MPPASGAGNERPGLFRQEAISATQDRWLGSVSISRPLSFSLITSCAIGVGASLAAFAAWGDITRKASLSGLLVPLAGSLGIAAPTSGVLAQVHILEGQAVQAGQALFTINTERVGAGGDTGALVAQSLIAQRSSLESDKTLRTLQARQRLDALSERARSIGAELRQVEGEAELQAQRIALAEKTLNRHQDLAKAGFVSEAQTQTKTEELLDLRARERAAQRNRTALERDASTVASDAKATQTSLATELAQIDRSISSLSADSSENEARRSTVVAAAQGGTITALSLKTGQSVSIGQTLATLVPQLTAPNDATTSTTSPLEAHLFAPSRSIGFVQIGQTVMLRHSAYPYQKFGLQTGTITAISTSPTAAQDLPAGSQQILLALSQSNEPLYRIRVKLNAQEITAYGQRHALKPGAMLEADVMQDKRKIWEFIMEPVLAARENAKARF